MAGTKISALPAATALSQDDLLTLVQGGVNKKATFALLAAFASRGFTVANNGSDTNNDIDFAAGACPDDTYSAIMVGSALTKRLDAVWVVGTNQGGLDTGVKANSTWYYCYVIRNPTSGVVDALFSASASSPTMPAGYTQKMLVMVIRTDGSGNIEPFTQIDNEVRWTTAKLDVNAGTIPGSATAVTVTAPPLAGVRALLTIYMSAAPVGRRFGIRPSADEAALWDAVGQTGQDYTAPPVYVPTNNGQVWWIASSATNATSLVCYGWKFPSRPVFAGG